MTRTTKFMLKVAIGYALVAAAALAVSMAAMSYAAAQDSFQSQRPLGLRGVGHLEHHQYYNRLPVNKIGTHCCNDLDCRPTQARWIVDHWEVMVDGVWKVALDHTILDQAYLQAHGTDRWDAQAHVCAGANGRIYCVIPPDSGN
jgi:hypothetical protein